MHGGQNTALLSECVRNIGKDVFDRFATDAESNEPLADCIPTPARSSLSRRMHTTKARCLANERKRVEKKHRTLLRAEIETHHASECAHLSSSNVMTGMIRQSGIVH